MTRHVFITFDVECSMGGAWGGRLEPIPPSRGMMGQYGSRRLGIPLIVEILETNGLAGTFFVEPFNDELGYPGRTEPVVEYLLDHGQDVQLHIHPNHVHYGLKRAGKEHPRCDQIGELPPAAQREMIASGAERLARWTGRRPVAFRAGNMGASEVTLDQLRAEGIGIDSSYTFPYLGGQCLFADRQEYNGSKWYGDMLEVALSAYRQARLPGLHPSKPVDLVGICFGECRDAIRAICGAGADCVMILHSFSLFKVRDVQYAGGRLNRIVTRRFRRTCRWLAEGPSAPPTATFSDLAGWVREGRYEAGTAAPPEIRRRFRALIRKAVQGYNNLYWT